MRRAVLVLVILLTPAIGWSQAQFADDSILPDDGQQLSTSQSNPAPAPLPDKPVPVPGQATVSENKKTIPKESRPSACSGSFRILGRWTQISSFRRYPPARNSTRCSRQHYGLLLLHLGRNPGWASHALKFRSGTGSRIQGLWTLLLAHLRGWHLRDIFHGGHCPRDYA